jgi:hypothetical protein
VFRSCAFDLLAEPVQVDRHHRVMCFARRTAQGIVGQDDAEAQSIAASVSVSTQTSVSPPVMTIVSIDFSRRRRCGSDPVQGD